MCGGGPLTWFKEISTTLWASSKYSTGVLSRAIQSTASGPTPPPRPTIDYWGRGALAGQQVGMRCEWQKTKNVPNYKHGNKETNEQKKPRVHACVWVSVWLGVAGEVCAPTLNMEKRETRDLRGTDGERGRTLNRSAFEVFWYCL